MDPTLTAILADLYRKDLLIQQLQERLHELEHQLMRVPPPLADAPQP